MSDKTKEKQELINELTKIKDELASLKERFAVIDEERKREKELEEEMQRKKELWDLNEKRRSEAASRLQKALLEAYKAKYKKKKRRGGMGKK